MDGVRPKPSRSLSTAPCAAGVFLADAGVAGASLGPKRGPFVAARGSGETPGCTAAPLLALLAGLALAIYILLLSEGPSLLDIINLH